MKLFRDLLKSKAPTSTALRQALAELPIAAAAAALAAAEARYREQLIEGESGPAIEATERQIVEAKREHERLKVYHEELSSQLAAAAERERVDALHARAHAAEKEGAAVADAFSTRYDKLVGEMVTLFDRLEAAENEARNTNAALRQGGLRIAVPGIEGRITTRLTLIPGRHLHHHAKYADLTGTPGNPFPT